jgi:hypothetical protein
MKKDISMTAFIERAKEMAYLMAFSAIAFVMFVVLTSIGS